MLNNILPQSENFKTLTYLLMIVAAMVGLAYASVPLYKLFCQVTGYGGTTQVTNNKSTDLVYDHPIRIRFDANVNSSLDWNFEPENSVVEIYPGEEVVVNYLATNLSPVATTGTSTFNVTPNKAGPFFMKLDCFCFIEQTLQVGESVSMPVRFFVDPEIINGQNTVDVREITLSYTFFPALKSNNNETKKKEL